MKSSLSDKLNGGDINLIFFHRLSSGKIEQAIKMSYDKKNYDKHP